jgi:hypothetical protein
MQAVTYPIKHSYQSTNNNCSQTALSMMLSYYGHDVTAEQIMEDIPVHLNDAGEPWGSINQQLATWCIGQGYQTTMYTFDCQIIDQSWKDLGKTQLLDRLEAAKAGRNVLALGSEWSKFYLQSYADYVHAGGELHIQPHVTTGLLYQLLQDGPVLACVCYNTMYGTGHSKDAGLRQSKIDDVYGKTTTHSIVVYGVTQDGAFEIADPWQEPGRHVIEPERLLCAITAAQIECDNLLFRVKK